MTKVRLLVGLSAFLVAGVMGATAVADPNAGPPICSGTEAPLAGTFSSLQITGNRYVAKGTTLAVTGDLTLAPGSCLDAFTLGTVHVSGDILVGKGAILALGCTPGSIGPTPPCNMDTTSDTVDGSIIARSAQTMYLDGDTIRGDVISDGGGPGPVFSPYVNFPIKDNVIYGNVFVTDWKGAWFGFIRNVTYGNVVITKNVGVAIGETGAPDSTEVVSNNIAGNLVCHDNNPPAQFGDSGGTPNTVGGAKIGQCAGL